MEAVILKSIGIIGGMGPLATADLFQKITNLTQANCDQEHIHIYIDSNTAIEDRTTAILHGGASPVPQLVSSAQKLEAAGADLLIIACNTAHFYHQQIGESVSIPVLNMIEECAKSAKNQGLHCVGILATEATCKSKLYENAFARYQITPIVPSPVQQAAVTALIYDCVKAGNFNFPLQPFLEAVENFKQQGAQALLLGCTELPIAFDTFAIPGVTLNATAILAESAIRAAGYPVKPT